MRISVFGLGYVGSVCSACLAEQGQSVIGIDSNDTKIELINRSFAPIIEPQLSQLVAKVVAAGRLRATRVVSEAVAETDLSLICVGTPSQLNGAVDLSYVRKVCEQIGAELARKNDFHIVAMRSTLSPGSMRTVVIPTLEEYSGRIAGEDFGVCINPEFLREGSAVNDFYHPPKTVIGELNGRSGDALATLYSEIRAPLIRTDLETAEMVKYTDNTWHAVKVAFANEIGVLCKKLNTDSHKVMDIFCQDTKLNLSAYYLKPGFAFGGSCLPKDVRGLLHTAKTLDLELPLLSAVLPSNERHIERAVEMVREKANKRVGILGFSFKAGTDDLRESPMIAVIERLLGKGYELRIYDENVQLSSLVGTNRDYLLNHIPHISKLMRKTIEEVVSQSETIVIGTKSEEFAGIMSNKRAGQVVVDLVRVTEAERASGSTNTYDGICW